RALDLDFQTREPALSRPVAAICNSLHCCSRFSRRWDHLLFLAGNWKSLQDALSDRARHLCCCTLFAMAAVAARTRLSPRSDEEYVCWRGTGGLSNRPNKCRADDESLLRLEVLSRAAADIS